MKAWRWMWGGWLLLALAVRAVSAGAQSPVGSAQGADVSVRSSGSQIHIPIGIPNTVDTLKTFVEPDGSFSPGFGSFGVSFRLVGVGEPPSGAKGEAPSGAKGESAAAAKDEAAYGLRGGGLLIPWCRVPGEGPITGTVETCAVARPSLLGDSCVVATRVKLENRTDREAVATFYVYVTPNGPAGGPIHGLAFSQQAFFVEGNPVLVANTPARGAILSSGPFEERSLTPQTEAHAESATGDCRGEMVYEVQLAPGQSQTFGFICPVLPGRRAVGHEWDGKSPWAQFDLADPISGDGGVLQPVLGVDFCRSLAVDDLFAEAEAAGRKLAGQVRMELPDPCWAECFAAITGHVALAMNEGAPDVAVINYNVFNRDGVYVANILQKSGAFELAAKAIDYFLAHPFNGRIEPEADNPGQVLWILGEHWKFTRDRTWLERIYPSAQKLAAMIEYYRTTPEPHWVNSHSLDFGEALPPEKRQKLRPGACDGTHPEYTEAFDLAGLRGGVVLAEAMKNEVDLAKWTALTAQLAEAYDQRFGADLRKGEYGNYSVLWPCRLYPLDGEKARAQFGNIGAQKPTSWRYFPLARAHQGFYAGNRAAAAETLGIHLDHEQMRGWYAFDEGGPSGPGNWAKVRSNWHVERNPDGSAKSAMAMPHGWSIAEMQLLLRDALAYEDDGKLILFAGVPKEWFAKPMRIENLPTYFGRLTAGWEPSAEGGVKTSVESGSVRPPNGVFVRTPDGDVRLPTGTGIEE